MAAGRALVFGLAFAAAIFAQRGAAALTTGQRHLDHIPKVAITSYFTTAKYLSYYENR